MKDDGLFGEIAVQEGFLTRNQLDAIQRSRNGKSLSEAALAQGLLSKEQVRLIDEIGKIQLVEISAAGESGGILRQDRYMLPCSNCDTYYLIQEHPEGTRFVCRKCKRVLTVQKDPTAEPKPGTRRRALRIGSYDTSDIIGRGSMSVLYKAVHRDSGRVVALKVLREFDPPRPNLLKRFRQEARAARKLSHPSIVPVHEAGEADGYSYIAMDYVEGTTLDRVLEERKMRLPEFASMLEQVCHAVHHAHEKEIIHRDLKPANILIDAANRPHVTDFGLAKMTHTEKGLTHGGISLGTPYYMSPEQVEGKTEATDARSDVYSLGVLLYEAMTGRVPYPGNAVMDVYKGILAGAPEPPRRLNPRAPAALEAICLKAIQRDPDLRYPTARALAEDLRRYAEGKPVEAEARD